MTTFIHKDGQLCSYQIKLASDAKVVTNLVDKTVTLYINGIVKEELDFNTFTIDSFDNYISNLREYYGAL